MKKITALEVALEMSLAPLCVYTQIILRNRGIAMSTIGIVCSIGQLLSMVLPLFLGGIVDRRGKDQFFLLVIEIALFFCYIPATIGKSDLLALITTILFFMLVACQTPISDGYLSRYLNGDASKYSKIRALGTMGYTVMLVGAWAVGYPDPSNNSQILIFIGVGCLLLVLSAFMAPDCPPVPVEGKKESFNFKWFDKKFYFLIFLVGLGKIGMVVPDRYISTYMTEKLGLGNYYTLFFAIAPFCEFFGMIIGGNLLREKKINAITLFIISEISIFVRLILYRYATSLATFALAQLMHFACYGLCHISVMNFIGENVAKEHYSSANSFYNAVGSGLPQAIFTLIGGYIIDLRGYNALFVSYATMPLLATILCIVFKKMLTSKT